MCPLCQAIDRSLRSLLEAEATPPHPHLTWNVRLYSRLYSISPRSLHLIFDFTSFRDTRVRHRGLLRHTQLRVRDPAAKVSLRPASDCFCLSLSHPLSASHFVSLCLCLTHPLSPSLSQQRGAHICEQDSRDRALQHPLLEGAVQQKSRYVVRTANNEFQFLL